MGAGRWDDSSWEKTVSARSTLSRDAIYTQQKERRAHTDFDTRSITIRESCDSQDNPNSTPIIIGMDVTGSMLEIPRYFAQSGLGRLIKLIHDKKPVQDPHVMVMALGDAKCDRYPLQATQFEADNRLSEQMVKLFLEGGGGGNASEGYDLPWLFAATRCKVDSFKKRGKKGFILTYGDEPAPNFTYSKEELERQIGGTYQGGMTSADMLELARQEWSVFHIIIEQGSRGTDGNTLRSWQRLLGPNAIRCDNYERLAELIVATMRVAEGEDADRVIAESGEGRATVERAFNLIEQSSLQG